MPAQYGEHWISGDTRRDLPSSSQGIILPLPQALTPPRGGDRARGARSPPRRPRARRRPTDRRAKDQPDTRQGPLAGSPPGRRAHLRARAVERHVARHDADAPERGEERYRALIFTDGDVFGRIEWHGAKGPQRYEEIERVMHKVSEDPDLRRSLLTDDPELPAVWRRRRWRIRYAHRRSQTGSPRSSRTCRYPNVFRDGVGLHPNTLASPRMIVHGPQPETSRRHQRRGLLAS